MKGITFICCVNDDRQFNGMLGPSLEILSAENIDYNILKIDTRERPYRSAAEAYNTEVRKNEAILKDILVFLHQDIAFDSSELFLAMIDELTANPKQILGVAGMPETGKTISNLRYQSDGSYITQTRLAAKTEVCSVDECCFAISKECFFKLFFDEKVCDNWHLYAVELCYHASVQNQISSYVLPHSIYHKENGTGGLTTDSAFLKTMWKVARKYRNKASVIYTPCYIVRTSFLSLLLKLCRTYIKNAYLKAITRK